ncbi:heme-binding domain-containing protein [Methylobacter marinus]|uniref:heme-binding domain-containing protein n=1 Tax=Methylobacter marinus TaxID=34058 RepID=UPI00037A3587|nr:heme-binding domain-containing protein [Methylobacter marinus]
MTRIQWFLLFLLAVILFFPISNLIGLTGENEPVPVVSGSSESFTQVSRILQNKCVDCHSPGMTRMPIYSDLPIAKQLMERDVEEAGDRLVLSKQVYSGEQTFTPLMLARLENVIRNDSMPLRYIC